MTVSYLCIGIVLVDLDYYSFIYYIIYLKLLAIF